MSTAETKTLYKVHKIRKMSNGTIQDSIKIFLSEKSANKKLLKTKYCVWFNPSPNSIHILLSIPFPRVFYYTETIKIKNGRLV